MLTFKHQAMLNDRHYLTGKAVPGVGKRSAESGGPKQPLGETVESSFLCPEQEGEHGLQTGGLKQNQEWAISSPGRWHGS